MQIFAAALFITVVSELGCFFRSAALVERYGSAHWVCLGTLAGNACLLLPLWFGGDWLRLHLPPDAVRWLSGAVLLLLGLLVLLEGDR